MAKFEELGKSILGTINQQIGLSENIPNNPQDPYSYAGIGDFASKISQSEQRTYLQSGYTRALRPQAMEVLLQEPDLTIIVKKRQFSSLIENYQVNKLSYEEKLYLKAVKRLFYNKCRAIASYERLTKIEKVVTQSGGAFNDFIMPMIFSSVETLNTLKPGLISGNTLAILDTLKKVKNFSDPERYTTWLNSSEIPYLTDVGEGTGAFELTLATSVSTSVSTELGRGNGSISLENPFELMIITEQDIEQAISDVVGFTNIRFFSIAENQLNDATNLLKEELSFVRKNRKATPINFMISPDSLNYKKVRAIIDEEGREIIFSYDSGVLGVFSFDAAGKPNEFNVSLDSTAYEGINGLQTEKERTLFKTIVANLYSLFALQKSRKNDIVNFNEQNNFIRKKMRLEFEEKAIIQNQDIVHIFVGSKTVTDPRVSEGFNFSYSKNNLLNNIDKGINEVAQSLNDAASMFSGGKYGSNFVQLEKNAIVGPDFPTWLWYIMRNDFTRQAAGVHIFAGIVNNVSQSYSGGKHNINVTCADFADYLQKGQINVKPSLDVVDSSLYDPLTPFKIDYDPSTGLLSGANPQLLDENITLLNTESVRLKAGRNRGNLATLETYNVKDSEILDPTSPTSAQLRNQFFDPDGFIYRWKQGIGTLVLSGAPNDFGTGSLRKETSSVITNNIFSGQDVMNTLSLLITGQPYNYSTFLKAASKAGFISSEKYLGFNSSDNFLKGLIKDLNRTNAIWGNFIPFKKLSLSNTAYQTLIKGELDATTNNVKLNDLLKQRAEKYDKALALAPKSQSTTGANNSVNSASGIVPVIDFISAEIYDLNQQINALQASFVQSISNVNSTNKGQIKIFGDDIEIDYSLNSSSVSKDQKDQDQFYFRAKQFELTQRRLWKVKANEDQNFFIVDDAYDKNYDIQAFEDSLGNLDTFKSTYSSIFDLVQTSASLLGLEIFADSQGHINARPPAYNRIPSSVFFKLLKDKDEKGIKIFPDYLESLFFNQVQGLVDQLEILEDQIRIRSYILGFTDDQKASLFLGNGDGAKFQQFNFLTDQNGSFQGRSSIEVLLKSSDPEFRADINRQPLSELSSIVSKVKRNTINFDISQRIKFIETYTPQYSDGQRLKEILLRLKSKGFIDPISNDYSNYGKQTSLETLEMTAKISSLVSERQYIIKLLSNAIKNLEEGNELNASQTSTNASTKRKIQNNDKIPEIILHMIEDENIDDLGPNAGSRFIIKDSHLLDFTINENPPPFTMIEVNGALAQNLVNGPSGLEVGSNGNFISSAFAVDYDMWRMYGFKGAKPVTASYLTDPVAQCAPYAVFLLNQSRKNIFTASVTVKGNEYIQAGEVYYLECRDLLMYAESVDHRFDFSGNFTTTLKCTYVRKPGEFIPTMLDIVGKGLYTRKNSANLAKVVRNANPSTDVPLTALQLQTIGQTPDDTSPDKLIDAVGGSFGEFNKNAIASLLISASGILTPSRYGDRIKIKLRIYYNSNTKVNKANQDLINFANEVAQLLVNPESILSSTPQAQKLADPNIQPTMNPDDIEIDVIDLGATLLDDIYSPSANAWNLARSFCQGVYDSNTLRDYLYLNVIDVWATSEPNTDTGIETSNSKTSATNQADQEAKRTFQEEFRKKINI